MFTPVKICFSSNTDTTQLILTGRLKVSSRSSMIIVHLCKCLTNTAKIQSMENHISSLFKQIQLSSVTSHPHRALWRRTFPLYIKKILHKTSRNVFTLIKPTP